MTSGTAGSQSYHNNTQASSYNGQQTSAPAHHNAVTHHRYHYGSTPAPNKYKSVANQGNLYAYGNCTYYVFNRRSELDVQLAVLGAMQITGLIQQKSWIYR